MGLGEFSERLCGDYENASPEAMIGAAGLHTGDAMKETI
jgi:hypothetical protein